jgi:hypothetical protein
VLPAKNMYADSKSSAYPRGTWLKTKKYQTVILACLRYVSTRIIAPWHFAHRLAFDYIKTTFPVHFLYNSTLIFRLTYRCMSLWFWARVHFDLRRTKLQFVRTPIHSGRTNNKPQFHFCRTEYPVASSLRRTISRMGRTLSVTDQYF